MFTATRSPWIERESPHSTQSPDHRTPGRFRAAAAPDGNPRSSTAPRTRIVWHGRSSLLALLLLVSMLVSTRAGADYGSVWVSNSTPNTLTIKWSHPNDSNLKYVPGGSPLVKICWSKGFGGQAIVDAKTCTGASSQATTNGDSFTITGVAPGEALVITVYGWTLEWKWALCCPVGWAWRNPAYRRVNTIVVNVPVAGGLLPIAADFSEVKLNATVSTPAAYDMVRIGYKRIGSLTALDFQCKQRTGPPTNWTASDQNRGWMDFSPVQSQFNAVFTGLRCNAKYRFSLYAFTPDSNIGTKLTSVTVKTKGSILNGCSWFGTPIAPNDTSTLLSLAIATDHATVLVGYAALLESHFGGASSLCADPRASDCCIAHGSPGCSDASCEATVCSLDPFCCEVTWDGPCAALAEVVCELGVIPTKALIEQIDMSVPGLADLLEATKASLDDIDVFDPYVGDDMFLLLEWLMLDHEDGAAFWQWQETDPTLAANGLLFTDYVAKHAPEVLEAIEDSAVLTYGAPSFTQSAAPNLIVPGTSIACVDPVAGVTFDYSHARIFTVPPQGITVGRVEFGVELNTHVPIRSSMEAMVLRAYLNFAGGPTTYEVLAIAPVLIDPSDEPVFYHADFPAGLHFAEGELLIVELAFPNLAPLGGGMIFSGCNSEGQTAPTYVRSTTCGAPEYVDLASLGFPDAHLAMTVHSLTADVAPCPADLNGDGSVNGADLGSLLSSWGPCGSCAADLNGDGVVDGADLGVLLAAWGECP